MAKNKRNGCTTLARELGISAAAVSQKMQRGMTSEQIRDEWRAKRTAADVAARGYTPARTLKSRSEQEPANAAAAPARRVSLLPVDPDEMDDPGDVEEPNFFIAKTRKEYALAEKHELDLYEQRGHLVAADKIRKHYADGIVRARGAFLRLPGELGDMLAAESNPAKCSDMLDRELRRILDMLADSEDAGQENAA